MTSKFNVNVGLSLFGGRTLSLIDRTSYTAFETFKENMTAAVVIFITIAASII
jgi:acyl-CoA hydrolase